MSLATIIILYEHRFSISDIEVKTIRLFHFVGEHGFRDKGTFLYQAVQRAATRHNLTLRLESRQEKRCSTTLKRRLQQSYQLGET